MRILAVDLGLEGAAAVLERINGTVVTLVDLVDLPIVGEAAKRRLDAVPFSKWVTKLGVSHAYVEAANAMPGQGVSSMFRYGRVAGSIEGVIAASQVPARWRVHCRAA
jgi:crossover junction endodeoxyribonuclease RuvC